MNEDVELTLINYPSCHKEGLMACFDRDIPYIVLSSIRKCPNGQSIMDYLYGQTCYPDGAYAHDVERFLAKG